MRETSLCSLHGGLGNANASYKMSCVGSSLLGPSDFNFPSLQLRAARLGGRDF